MSDFNCIPISYVDNALLSFDARKRAWLADLEWDYSGTGDTSSLTETAPVTSFKDGMRWIHLLPRKPGERNHRSLYASASGRSQETVDQLVRLAATSLKEKEKVNRIEVQIMPLTARTSLLLHAQRFHLHERSYLRLT